MLNALQHAQTKLWRGLVTHAITDRCAKPAASASKRALESLGMITKALQHCPGENRGRTDLGFVDGYTQLRPKYRLQQGIDNISLFSLYIHPNPAAVHSQTRDLSATDSART